MADSLASAWVEVLPDFKNFRNSANSEMSSVLGSAGDVGGLAAGKGIQGGILGTIGNIALPLIAAFGAVEIGRFIGEQIGNGINFALDGIDLASNLEQSQGAVNAIFAEASAAVSDFASGAVNDLGLTENAYNELATVLGSQLKNGGTALDELAGKTNNLIVTGADLAATFGGSTTDAVNALSSALRGERDPIEQYGVSLTQAAIDAKAAELGFTKVGGALSTQANQAATLAIIMDQTAAASGRFAAESDTLAGQQARLAAAFESAQTTLGTALLPVMTELATLANDELIPILNEVIAEIGPVLAEALKESAPAFQELVLAVAPLIPDLVRLGVELLPVMIQGLILIAPLLTDWANNTTFVTSMMNDLFSLLNGDTSLADIGAKVLGFGGSLAAVAIGLGTFSAQISANFARFSADVQTNVGLAVSFITGLPGAAVAALGNLGSTLYGSGKALLQGFVDGIKAMLKPVGDAVSNVLSFAKGFFPRSPAERGPFSGAGWTAVAKSGEAIMDQFASGLFGPDLSLAMGSVSLPSFAGSSSAVAPSANGAVASSAGFTNNGTIITQDVPAFFAEKAKSDRRALALEGIDGSLVA